MVLSDAVPLPGSLVGSSFAAPGSESGKKPYAKAMILITIFHHLTTAFGAYQHWIKPTHRTVAMDIGVFANVALTALGIAALAFGLDDHDDRRPVAKRTR